ncbi:MAG: aspartate carbamoyltransferase catalytic subunit [Phycisphaerales bacterium]|nr:aspartate carbamoyltransferase catalytic subunit [Phycisphaerales bacterium]
MPLKNASARAQAQAPAPTTPRAQADPVGRANAAPAEGGVGATPEGGAPGEVWTHRHLLGLGSLTAAELRALLETARSFADVSTRSIKKVPALRGKVVANLFFEDSTRTRISFTLAAQRLSADVVDLTGAGSSVSKGETIDDTAANIEAMGVDAVVVRHKSSGAAALVARAVRCAVINAGDGKHEHPTQGLLDIYTLAQAHGRLDTFDLSGLTVAIVGDVVSSRVARSGIAGMTALGARVVCVGPPTLAPRSLEALGRGGPGSCVVESDFMAVLPTVDAVNMLRIQFERHTGVESAGMAVKSSPAFPSLREYSQMYALTVERAARMKDGAIVMHPGPINRGVELAGEVADGARSVILKQVTNGLAVRMAALYMCVGRA